MSQSDLSSQISIFSNIATVCLVIFIIALIISAFFFIRLNVPGVIGFLTGHSQRKTVAKMMEDEDSGRLTSSGKKKKKKNLSRKEVANSIMTPSGQLKKPGSDEVMLSTGNDITDVLNKNSKTAEKMEETPEGNNASSISASGDPSLSDEALASRKITKPMGRFVIEKSIIMIHTDERIA